MNKNLINSKTKPDTTGRYDTRRDSMVRDGPSRTIYLESYSLTNSLT